MPFHHTPPGFSPASLHLLDVALTKTWLERVASGAVLSAADPALCAELQAMVMRMERLQSGQRTDVAAQPENRMVGHKFKVGQRVLFHSPRRAIGPLIVTVVRKLPTEGQGVTYRIKSIEEGFERVANEGELSSIHEAT